MSHSLFVCLLLFAVAFVAGAINSVAGGGTLLTFPALHFAGLSAIMANATNTLALVPGSASAMWAYRSDIAGSKREMWLLGIPSILGGIVGALLVIRAGDKTFSTLVPWLIFGATALFIIQEPISRMLSSSAPSDNGSEIPRLPRQVGVAVFQFFVAVYGGFFGAGIGILMLAALGFMGFAKNIHRANGVKNFAAVCINGVAAITFILQRQIDWQFAGIMAVGAIAGGYRGAGLAKRLSQQNVRILIIFIGITIGLAMLVQRL